MPKKEDISPEQDDNAIIELIDSIKGLFMPQNYPGLKLCKHTKMITNNRVKPHRWNKINNEIEQLAHRVKFYKFHTILWSKQSSNNKVDQ